MRRAIYAGSFDPLTYGHLWVIEQGANLFDEIIVAVGQNPQKKYKFSEKERIDTLQSSVKQLTVSDKIIIDHFSKKYLVDYAKEKNANFILRGVRNVQDFEYERALRNINSDIEFGDPTITTVFLIPPRELSEVSSSFVKALCGPQNWQKLVSKFVPAPVLTLLESTQSQN